LVGKTGNQEPTLSGKLPKSRSDNIISKNTQIIPAKSKAEKKPELKSTNIRPEMVSIDTSTTDLPTAISESNKASEKSIQHGSSVNKKTSKDSSKPQVSEAKLLVVIKNNGGGKTLKTQKTDGTDKDSEFEQEPLFK
jgi:hypothetical protein